MKKWIVCFPVILQLCLTAFAADYTYTVNSDDTVTITGYGGSGGAIVIPDAIEGKPVTAVGSYAFYWNTSLTSVRIGNSVSNIGISAFYKCYYLTNAIVGNGVTTIGDAAFFGCNRLRHMVIPDGVTVVGDRAFKECSGLTNVTIGNSVGIIGVSAFESCGSLVNVEIPPSVTNIGSGAFYSCGLISLTIPGSVALVDNSTFSYCTDLTNVTIEAGVTALGLWVFMGCSSLTSIILPDSITFIGQDAFCFSGLKNIVVPESVSYIGGGAFDCGSLEAVYFKGNAPEIGDLLFGDNDQAIIYYLSDTTGWGSTFGGHPTQVWRLIPDLLADEDLDGIPDSWEQQHFGGTTNANPSAVCSNGINTVRQAYIAGLNPNDRQSMLRAVAPADGKTLGWNAVSGRVYSVYWTTNLLATGFQCLESNIPWTRGSFTNQATVPCGYYKIAVRLE